MKKIICMLLTLIMLCGTLASCSQLKDGDKGSIITTYLCDQIYDYDPIVGFNDTSKAQVISLVFEGLTTLDSEGNWKKAMMKSYEYKKPTTDDDYYKLIINLADSRWSDGRTVQANDFVYAWKRIVEPTTKCEAAVLLYDIVNAYDIKMGDATVDDLGVYAVETYKLQINFTHDIDVNEFFRTCASVALVPLREDKAGNDVDWAKRASTMVTNGPFDIRKITYGQELILERSSYYRRDKESNEALDKYVTPYRIIVYYKNGDASKQLEGYENNDLFYLTNISMEARGTYAKSAKVQDRSITTTVYFNTSNKLFNNADVRKALSLALDREAIAEQLVFSKAATGLVPYGISDANYKGDFRETADKSGSLINKNSNIDEAKSLLNKAGVKKGSFTLSVRDNEYDLTIANLIADTWNELGFNVKVKTIKPEQIQNKVANQSIIYTDSFAKAFSNGEFDAILIDLNALNTDAFSILAPFSPEFSGNGVDMISDNYDTYTHITGYSNSAYDELIVSAYESTDSSERTSKLHEAEEMLLEEMPIVPVVFVQDGYLVNSVISGVTETFWGRSFVKTSMKDYMKYKESILEANNEEEVSED